MKTFLTVLFLVILCGSAYPQMQTAKMWTRTYNSGLKDVNSESALDIDGNLYVAGYRSVTGTTEDTTARMFLLKYNPSGELLWSKTFQSKLGRRTLAFALALDEMGHAYISGAADTASITYSRAFIVKYNSQGDTLWTKYHGFGLYGWRFTDIALDNAGGVYAAFDLVIGGGASNYMMKLDTAGAHQWTTESYGNSTLPKVEVNSAGDIFLGYQKSPGIQQMDFGIVKFDSFGAVQWSVTYNSPNNLMDFIVHMKSEPATGDIIVTGYASIMFTPLEIQTIRFSSGIGAVSWVKRVTGSVSNSYNAPIGMAISPAGDVYICGAVTNTGTGTDGFLIRYNGMNGAERYRKMYNYNGGATNEGISSVSVTAAEQPLILGYRVAAKDIFIHRYSTNGGMLWRYESNDSLNQFEEGSSQIMHGSGSQVLAVTNYYNNISADINVIKFENISTSTNTFCKSINKHTVQGEYIYDTISVGLSANTLVRLEVTIDSLTHPDPKDLIIKLRSPQGAVIELFRNSGLTVPSTGLFGTVFSDTAQKTIDSGSATYTGYFAPKQPMEILNSYSPDGKWILMVYNMNAGDTGVVNKWCLKVTTEQVVGIQAVNNEIPAGYNLSQNYPNPFNPVTNIKFSLPKSGNVSLKVYDITGKQVTELVNGFKSAGSYIVDFNASHLASGVYFYRLEASEFSEVKRMVLVK